MISYRDAEPIAMGPDIIDSIMDIEETFDVHVPEEEWEQAPTVGELCETVCGALDANLVEDLKLH